MNQIERIQQLESKLEATQYILNELLNGLFNKHTQKETLDRHLDNLYQTNKFDSLIREAPLLHTSPSTRQGDVHAIYIKQLEEKILSLKDDTSSQTNEIEDLQYDQQNIEMRLLVLEKQRLQHSIVTLEKKRNSDMVNIAWLIEENRKNKEHIDNLMGQIQDISMRFNF